jgi:hypothetical protein
MCGLLDFDGEVRLMFVRDDCKELRWNGKGSTPADILPILYPKIIPADQAAFLVPPFLHQDIRVLVNAGTASRYMTHLEMLALSSEKGDQLLNKQSTVNMSRFAAVRRQARHRVSETLNAPPPPAASAQSTICIHLMPIRMCCLLQITMPPSRVPLASVLHVSILLASCICLFLHMHSSAPCTSSPHLQLGGSWLERDTLQRPQYSMSYIRSPSRCLGQAP